MKYALLGSSIFFNVLTNVGFNLSALNELSPVKKWSYFAVSLIFGLINSVLFMESLKYISLQSASAVYFALTIIGLFLVSYFGFKEQVSLQRLIGVTVIVVGVIMVSLSDPQTISVK